MSTKSIRPVWYALFLLASLFIPALAAAKETQDSNSSQSSTQAEQGKPAMMELWSPGDKGQRMRIRGRVIGEDGKPIPNVKIRFRHADADGINRSYHQGTLETNERGVYQFGSVIPGNNHRLSHVHVYISHPGYRYLETEFYFKEDPKANPDDPNSIFLEEGTIDDIKMKYGRWDVTLTPG